MHSCSDYTGTGVSSISKGTVIRDLKIAREKTAKNKVLMGDLEIIIEEELEAIKKNRGNKDRLFGTFIATIVNDFGVILINNAENEELRLLYEELTILVSNHLLSSNYNSRDYKLFMNKVRYVPRESYLQHMILSSLTIYVNEITMAFDKLGVS